MLVPSDYAIRALHNPETNSSEGWEILKITAEHENTCYGVKMGQVRVPFMEVGSVTLLQYIVSTWLDQKNLAQQEARDAERVDFKEV